MPLGDPSKLRQRVEPFLEPGEQLVAVVHAESGISRWFLLLSTWLRYFIKHWLIARTDRRILVFSTTRFRRSTPRELRAEYPLDTTFQFRPTGPWLTLDLAGDSYRVSRSFRGELEIATGVRQREQEQPMTAECAACGSMNYESAAVCRKCRHALPSSTPG